MNEFFFGMLKLDDILVEDVFAREGVWLFSSKKTFVLFQIG